MEQRCFAGLNTARIDVSTLTAKCRIMRLRTDYAKALVVNNRGSAWVGAILEQSSNQLFIVTSSVVVARCRRVVPATSKTELTSLSHSSHNSVIPTVFLWFSLSSLLDNP